MESGSAPAEVTAALAKGPGKAVILSGPSGVGKDTILDLWIGLNPLVSRVVAATTRTPRPGEVNGESYWFLSNDEFEAKIREGGFIEHKAYGEHQYGTPVAQTVELIEQGRIAVLKIEVEGALDVMRRLPSIESVFILPPSRFTLDVHLRERGMPAEEIEQRLKIADGEIMKSDRYRFRLVNHEGRAADTAREVETLLGRL